MAGRKYSIQFSNVAVTAQQDLFMIAPVANKPIAIHGLFLGQTTELGDAEDEMLRYSIIRGHTTVGSAGTSVTPVRMRPLDIVSGATCRVNDTTIAASGTTTIPHTDVWAIRAGEKVFWTPETQILCSSTETRIVVRLLTTPADSVTCSGTLYFEELN